jgi:hypothetical protein
MTVCPRSLRTLTRPCRSNVGPSIISAKVDVFTTVFCLEITHSNNVNMIHSAHQLIVLNLKLMDADRESAGKYRMNDEEINVYLLNVHYSFFICNRPHFFRLESRHFMYGLQMLGQSSDYLVAHRTHQWNSSCLK